MYDVDKRINHCTYFEWKKRISCWDALYIYNAKRMIEKWWTFFWKAKEWMNKLSSRMIKYAWFIINFCAPCCWRVVLLKFHQRTEILLIHVKVVILIAIVIAVLIAVVTVVSDVVVVVIVVLYPDIAVLIVEVDVITGVSAVVDSVVIFVVV